MSIQKLKSIINKYDYISFDIFDTLIVRNVLKPSDVFVIVENKYNKNHDKKINSFAEKRKLAEIKARKKNDHKEITISEIYAELDGFTSRQKFILKQLEISTEINICLGNNEMIEVYDYCKKIGKKLIVTSDMYLEESTIKKILTKAKIDDYEKLFLSSKTKLVKYDGSVFPFIKRTTKAKNILHIGDNLLSDFIMPRIHRISSFHYKKRRNRFIFNKKAFKKSNQYKILDNFICNTLNANEDYYYKFGYSIFGPILYGFTQWLIEKIPKNKKIFFLARDGYIMKQAYEIISNNKNVSYLYASRQALIVPILWKEKDFSSMLSSFDSDLFVKMSTLFRKLGLEEQMINKTLQENELDNYSVASSKLTTDSSVLKLYNILKDDIYENSKEQNDLLLQYLKQEKFLDVNSPVIVDIGWHGNMQMAISKILPKKYSISDGYYVCLHPKSKFLKNGNLHGFLLNGEYNSKYHILVSFLSIFESFFSAPHGSTKKYKKASNGKIEPAFFEYEYEGSIEEKCYQKARAGALDFVRNLNTSPLSNIFYISSDTSIENLRRIATHPTYNDTNKFGDFIFMGDTNVYVAKPQKSLLYYVFHPKKLFVDLFNSGWKVGFLIRLTHVDFFYYWFYLLIAKIFKF